jgi:CheY-like chemotaxis protein
MKPQARKLVFIVDDDPEDRQLILDAFLKNGSEFDYVFIDNAAQLLNRLKNGDHAFPNLLLLDLNMPGVMGMQALREIRTNKIFSQIPIVVLTTSTLINDRNLCYEMGASCFLTKPDSFSTMLAYARSIVTLWL